MIYLPLQIIVSLFVILVVFRLTKKYKESALKTLEFFGWLVIWLGALVVFWLPQTTSYLALFLGIGRGVDLAMYVAVLMLFYLIFRLYLRLDKQQKEIVKIVRHLALTDDGQKKEKSQQI